MPDDRRRCLRNAALGGPWSVAKLPHRTLVCSFIRNHRLQIRPEIRKSGETLVAIRTSDRIGMLGEITLGKTMQTILGETRLSAKIKILAEIKGQPPK